VVFSLLITTKNILDQCENQATSRESTNDALNQCRTPSTHGSALKDAEEPRCTQPALEASSETTCAEQSVLEDNPKEDREIRLTSSGAETAEAKQGEKRTSQKSRTDGQESGDEEGSGALRIVCDGGAETSEHVGRERTFRFVVVFFVVYHLECVLCFGLDCAEVRIRGSWDVGVFLYVSSAVCVLCCVVVPVSSASNKSL